MKEKKLDWGELWKPILVAGIAGYIYKENPESIIGLIVGIVFLIAYRQAKNN